MTKITTFDRHRSQAFVMACEDALKQVAAEHGVTMDTGTWRYGGTRLQLPFTFNVTDENGEQATDPILEMMAKRFDIDHTATGFDGRSAYKIVGYNGRAPKNPWSLKRVSDGKGFKAPNGWVTARWPKLSAKTSPAPMAAAAMTTNVGSRGNYDGEF